VKYINDDLNDYSSHTYNKFLEMLLSYKPINPHGIKEALDSFQTVFLDIDSKIWHVESYLPEVETYTDKQMYELNPSPEELEEQKKNSSIITRTKKFVDNFSKDRVNKNINKFKDKGRIDGRNTKRY
jgi:hypothetical protein